MRQLFFFVCALSVACVAVHPQSLHSSTSEESVRSVATKAVRPLYPIDSKQQHIQGVVVAEIRIDAKGYVASVSVLEAPSKSISEAVSNALISWEFRPFVMKDGRHLLVSAKMTFYFVEQKGNYVVLSPNEVGYIGRWPLKSNKKVPT